MPKLEQILERVSKTDPFVFNLFKDKLKRENPNFFDDFDLFYGMACISSQEYLEILKEEHRYFLDNHNGMDLS